MLEARYLGGLTYEGLLPRLWRNRGRVEAFYEGPGLAEAYAKEGKRIVPTVVFLDGAYGELARWHGPPEAARAFLREKKAEGLSPKALLLAYHRAFSRFAEAMLAEWRALLSP